MSKIGVALVNLGTPDSVGVSDVKKYLLEFLLDKRVIDLPFLQRHLLVKGFIVPRRKKASSELYKLLPELSDLPLRHFGYALAEALEKALGEAFSVKLAMRYGEPSFKQLMQEWKEENLERLILIPLFPQYASATTGSVLELFFEQVKTWSIIPKVHTVHHFYDHPAFIKAWQAVASVIDFSQFDHTVFSYHGLPLRQLQKANIIGKQCKGGACCSPLSSSNKHCYRAQCLQTSRLLIEALNLEEAKCTTSFQSRLGRAQWLEPYTEEVIKQLAHEGKKRVAVFSPSFVTDCLETWVEIETEYAEIFTELGGEQLKLVPSLNSSSAWVEALKSMVLEEVGSQMALL